MKMTIHPESISCILTIILTHTHIMPLRPKFYIHSSLNMANNSASVPTTQPSYSTELELANTHLGLTYLALCDIVKRHPNLITTIHPVLLL
jgi:hypothetical protein